MVVVGVDVVVGAGAGLAVATARNAAVRKTFLMMTAVEMNL